MDIEDKSWFYAKWTENIRNEAKFGQYSKFL